MLILEDLALNCFSCGTAGCLQGFFGTAFAGFAMTDGFHAGHPAFDFGRCIQNARQGRRAVLREPQRVVNRKVGYARLCAEQKVLPVQHAGDPAQVAFVSASSVCGRHASRATAHGRAIGHKGLHALSGRARKDLGHASGLEVVGHGRREQSAVCPLRDDARCAFDGIRINRGRGGQML